MTNLNPLLLVVRAYGLHQMCIRDSRLYRRAGETLAAYLNRCVFADARSVTLAPDADDTDGFAKFLTEYKNALNAERAVVS